jgi:hypothetical protein
MVTILKYTNLNGAIYGFILKSENTSEKVDQTILTILTILYIILRQA